MASTNTAVRVLNCVGEPRRRSTSRRSRRTGRCTSVISASPRPRRRYGTIAWISGVTMLKAADGEDALHDRRRRRTTRSFGIEELERRDDRHRHDRQPDRAQRAGRVTAVRPVEVAAERTGARRARRTRRPTSTTPRSKAPAPKWSSMYRLASTGTVNRLNPSAAKPTITVRRVRIRMQPGERRLHRDRRRLGVLDHLVRGRRCFSHWPRGGSGMPEREHAEHRHRHAEEQERPAPPEQHGDAADDERG